MKKEISSNNKHNTKKNSKGRMKNFQKQKDEMLKKIKD